ncbi:MAG: TRIC cation channel family protein [Limisphaerales bacterium]
MLRDVLIVEIPVVLRADLYALAALAAAIVVVAGHMLHFSPIATTIVGGVLCFALRYMAIRHGWHLPTAWSPRRRPNESNPPDSRENERKS